MVRHRKKNLSSLYFSQFDIFIFKKTNYTDQPIQSPCLQTGASEIVATSQILGSNCANGLLFKYPSPIDIVLLRQRTSYTIIGTSEPDKCEIDISVLFPDPQCTYGNQSCSFNNAYLPSLGNLKFYVSFNMQNLFKKKHLNFLCLIQGFFKLLLQNA